MPRIAEIDGPEWDGHLEELTQFRQRVTVVLAAGAMAKTM